MKLSIIAAVGKNDELGKNGDLIWRFKDDMKFFKDMTWGHKIIMGRKTFDSLPKLLEGRKHLILTRKRIEFPEEVEVYHTISDFKKAYQNSEEEIFDIGGASIYEELLVYANKLYLTEIEAEDYEADVYFPRFNKDDYLREELQTHQDEKTGIRYKHVLYKRK